MARSSIGWSTSATNNTAPDELDPKHPTSASPGVTVDNGDVSALDICNVTFSAGGGDVA